MIDKKANKERLREEGSRRLKRRPKREGQKREAGKTKWAKKAEKRVRTGQR
jgi:hypothetical protein